MFDKFKGISREREIEAREESSLEHLIKVGEKAAKEYLKCIEHDEYGDDEAALLKLFQNNYGLVENALEKIEFTEKDLRYYILAMSNKGITTGEAGLLAVTYGMYTSMLLQLLTNRNKAEGKRTRFYVNGEGSMFDMLFGLAKDIDCLCVENFMGDGIGSMSGWLGNLNSLIANNIKGAALFSELAAYKGKVNLVIAKNIEGDALLDTAPPDDSCDGASIGLIIAENIKTKSCFSKIGKKGKIGMIIAKNIEGTDVLNDLATNKGRVGVVAGINISARLAFCNAGWQGTEDAGQLYSANPDEMGWVRRLLYENVKAEYVAPQIDSGFNEICCKEKNPEEYARQMQEYKINEILELVDSMEGKTPEEVFDIAEKIQSVYDSIKDKVET